MLNYGAWGGSDMEPIDSTQRAHDAWRRIQMKPHSITIVRRSGGSTTTLSAQTCRIEFETTVNDREGKGQVKSTIRDCVVFGVKGHPTVTDFNIERGDQFSWEGYQFTVHDVRVYPGEFQAMAEGSQ